MANGGISVQKFFSQFFFFFFFAGGFAPPHPPPGLRPWTPHFFGLRTLASQVLAQRHSIRTSAFYSQNPIVRVAYISVCITPYGLHLILNLCRAWSSCKLSICVPKKMHTLSIIETLHPRQWPIKQFCVFVSLFEMKVNSIWKWTIRLSARFQLHLSQPIYMLASICVIRQFVNWLKILGNL